MYRSIIYIKNPHVTYNIKLIQKSAEKIDFKEISANLMRTKALQEKWIKLSFDAKWNSFEAEKYFW